MNCPKHPESEHFVAVAGGKYVFCYSCAAEAIMKLGVPNLAHKPKGPVVFKVTKPEPDRIRHPKGR